MRSLKTAVAIWKKEIEFKFATWGIKEEERKNYRKRRQEWIRETKGGLISDLLNRNRIGDIILSREDLKTLGSPPSILPFRLVEEIYKKYL